MQARNFIDRSLKVLARQYPETFIKVALGSTEIAIYWKERIQKGRRAIAGVQCDMPD